MPACRFGSYFTDLQKLFPDETIHFELPPLEKTLDVDRAQIEQVLINLLKNAREASARRETPKIEVKAVFAPKVTSSLTAWRCTITVRDNGEGILPEVQDKIFVPFFTTKTAGSGIGLNSLQADYESAWRKYYRLFGTGKRELFYFTILLDKYCTSKRLFCVY